MAQVKGVSFKSVLKAVEALHGAAALETLTARLPPELGSALRYQELLATSWYPIAWYRALLAAVASTTGQGERALFEIGRQCAKQDMTGIYRLGFKLLSPEAVLALSTRLFSNYYDTGKGKVVESRRGYAHARWWGCEGFDRNMWWEAFGAAEMFMEFAGARSIRSYPLFAGGADDEAAELKMHWLMSA